MFSYGSIEEERCTGSTIVFREVGVKIGQKTILNRVSGMASAGEMLAIMGPSGAGKSTLMNVLGARLPCSSGRVTVNGQTLTRAMRRNISYVLQNDCFYPSLTLRETLTYMALLRQRDSMPYKAKIQRLQEIIEILDLNKCLDTKMGTTMNACSGGLSGGERKRASIACELLANPELLLIDEPTSGLDSTIAHSLMSSLHRYSHQQHKTVLTTIHQPSRQMFHLFTRILLLVKGEVAYFGPGDKILDFFAEIDLHCDVTSNPADFILDQVNLDPGVLQRIMKHSYVMRTSESWPLELQESIPLPALKTAEEGEVKAFKMDQWNSRYDTSWHTGFLTQYKTLTKRSFALTRHRFFSPVSIMVHLVNILIISLTWFRLARSEATVQDRFGNIFFTIATLCFAQVNTDVFCIYDAWGVFANERSAGMYRLCSYYLAILSAEFPLILLKASLYAVVCYWITGMTPRAVNFFAFWMVLAAVIFCQQSLGFMISVLVTKREFTAAVVVSVILLLMTSAGFYNKNENQWFAWIRFVSFIAYSYSALVEVEFLYGDDLRCNPPNMTSFPEYCKNGTTFPGVALFQKQEFHYVPIIVGIPVMITMTLVFNLIAYLVLRFCKATV